MNTVTAIWLPTLVSAIAVFLVSSIVHTVLRAWHRNDQSKLPNEDAIADALQSVPAGDYRLPFASGPEEMKSEAFQAKMKRGPMAIVTVMRVEFMASFRNALIQWFIYTLVVSWLSGHLAFAVLGVEADSRDIIHTVGLAAVLGYVAGVSQQAIWGGKPWVPTIKAMVDGVIYASVTAAVYCWLWPRA